MQEERFPGHKLLPYLLILPSALVIIIFLVIPFAQTIFESFFQATPFGTHKVFVGIANYIQLFEDMDYLHSVIITLIFSAFVIFVGLTISILIAMLANQKIKGIGFYQIALIWTYALSPAVAGTIWAMMFAPATGIMPYIISKLTNGYALNWMTNSSAALFIVSAAATWKMLGYNIVFFIAGLQNIPQELLESASVDGAGPWSSFFRIKFPMLSPTVTFLLFVNMLYAFFQVFGLIDIMTKGGPGNGTQILVYKLYQDGFVNLKTGFASAQSLVIFVAIAILALFQLRIATKRAVYER
ncbi:MAG: sugar ABC transporter permease [Spirochaetes bacterium]|nr:sugar ABC transporter permease [Spirochaetota bacterium]